ncbi:MAG: glycosyltransferase family 4 protein [Deltaproteobacteria bacterium]|nr:glycosyltransferase family 4 protein [Deltaproteobacteria bacterium]
MYHLVREVWQRGQLRQVVAVSKSRCQYEFDMHLIDTLPGERLLVSGLGAIKSGIWRGFPSRWLGEGLFDRYAASKLVSQGRVLLTTPRLPHTTRVAKALGYKVLLYGGAPNPNYLMEQIQLEHDTFGLKEAKNYRSRAWDMARFAAHVAQADYLLTPSEFAKETYVQQGFPRERLFVAPLGVDVRRFRATPAPTAGPFICLFVAHVAGSTGMVKGLPYLLQAWSELNLQNAQLLVCGKMGQEAQQLIQRYAGKLPNVEFTGPVSNVVEYYQKASVFVLPTLAEGLAKVVLEAMACGRPVITTPVLKPVVREGSDGFYVPPRDVTALKDRIRYFYQQREEVSRMGANASEQAHRFTWEEFSRRIADIAEKVAAA